MADIFLSYAREDLEPARRIAGEFETEGWSVFWDRRIPPGRKFEDYIEERLEECRVVVVLWSAHSVASDWVRLEAAHGRSRNCLVPVLIAPATIPFAFRHIQAADLTGWRPRDRGQDFQELLSSVESLAPRAQPDRNVDVQPPPRPSAASGWMRTVAGRLRRRPVLAVAAALMIVLALLLVLNAIRAPGPATGRITVEPPVPVDPADPDGDRPPLIRPVPPPIPDPGPVK